MIIWISNSIYLKRICVDKKFPLLLLLLLLLSCTKKNGETVSTETSFFFVDIGRDFDNFDSVKVSSIADSIRYIPLETCEKSLLPDIVDVCIKNGYIFVRTKEQQLFVFSDTGKFLNKIGSKGNGPKEYRRIIDFDVDDKYVYILDYGQIRQYNISGEYINSIRLPKLASQILKLNNGNFLCYIPDSQFKKTEQNYSFLIITDKGDSLNVINTSKLRDYSKEKISNNYMIINFSNKYNIAFKETFNDTLFCLNPNTLDIKKFGTIDYGIHKIDLNMHYRDIINADHNMRINKLIDVDNYLFIRYACQCVGNRTTHWAAYDKANAYFFNLCDELKEARIINDINDGPNFTPLNVVGNRLIGYLHAFEYNKLTFQGNVVNPDDNPIIIIAKLKSN